MRPVLFLLMHVAYSLQVRPLSKPKNYPLLAGAVPASATGATAPRSNVIHSNNLIGFEPPVPQNTPMKPQTLTALKPPVYEYGFPVVNVRYTYPPTAVDGRRRLAVAQRQAQILDNSAILEARIMKDFSNLMKHIGMQEQIVKLFSSIPWSSRTRIQETLLRKLSQDIPEVPPMSSFLEEHPQINVAVEDNSAEFVSGFVDSMRTDQALRHLQEIQRSQTKNRGKILDILKLNMKIFDLVMQYLRVPMMGASQQVKKTKPIAFIQQSPQASVQSPVYPPVPPTPVPGWYSNGTNVSVAGPVESGVQIPLGMDFPYYMKLRSRVMEGGAQGAKALAALIDLWNDQEGAKDAIRRTMVGIDCKMLMMSPKTPDYLKNLAGTLLTLISGIPAGSSVPDFTSGSYGHVNIVVPRPSRVYAADKEIALAEET